MDNLLMTGGRLLGALGILLCVLAVIWRLLGNHYLVGFEVASLLQGGTSAVLIGCFLLLLGRVDRDA
jgi:hypothetical protein